MDADPHRRGDFQLAVGALAAVGELDPRSFQLREHIVRRAEQQFALFGQDQAAGMPVKQNDGQILLQRADLTRHRRLRQTELFAGMRKAARFGGGVENLELVPVHLVCSKPITLPIRTGAAKDDRDQAPDASSADSGSSSEACRPATRSRQTIPPLLSRLPIARRGNAPPRAPPCNPCRLRSLLGGRPRRRHRRRQRRPAPRWRSRTAPP